MSATAPEPAPAGTRPALVTTAQANTIPQQVMISFSQAGDLWVDYPVSQPPAKEVYIAIGGSGIIDVPQGTHVFRGMGGSGIYLVYQLNDPGQKLELSWGFL